MHTHANTRKPHMHILGEGNVLVDDCMHACICVHACVCMRACARVCVLSDSAGGHSDSNC